jgi:Ca2+-transporting ATPase
MSGRGITDARAMKEASVGIGLGSGCQVCKDSSDLVILDNNLYSVFTAIMWGRTIFENVRKFLQFQLTINLSLCFLVMLTSITLGRCNFSVL